MNLGRRGGAPTSPPIPVRVPPPAAYGISVPGSPAPQGWSAPSVPQGQPESAPPPPPSAPPASGPSPFATYAPPTPLPPAIEYGAAAPTEASASRFGGYAGPAEAFAAPPATYGTPTWSTQPPKKQGSRLWAKVLAGAFSALVGFGFLVHIYDAATVHHVALAMPATIGDTNLDTSDQAQSVIAATIAKEQASGEMGRVKHFQAGIYRGPSGLVVADMADIHSNSAAFRDSLVNSFIGSETGTQVHSVTPGKQGGSESCGNVGSSVVCIWVDNGTVGAVFLSNVSDVTAAEPYLQLFRDQVER